MRWFWMVGFGLLAMGCSKEAVTGDEGTEVSGPSDDDDKDLDGWTIGDGDCDDTSGSINPGAEDICDGKDNNCDGEIDEGGSNTFYIDYDGDGFGTDTEYFTLTDCDAPDGYVSNADDCDDTNPMVHPSATEVCDGEDNNCDGATDEGLRSTQYLDADGDGFGDPAIAEERCGTTEGYSSYADDCDDSDPLVNPAAPEVCDGIDNNCRDGVDEGMGGTLFADSDGDGFGDPGVPIDACEGGEGAVDNDLDCNDRDPDISPDAIEVCDGIDNDCDGGTDDSVEVVIYPDYDGDGFGSLAFGISTDSCSLSPGYVYDGTDCDDFDASIHPAAVELCDGIDNNCNLLIDEASEEPIYVDADGDGFGDPSTGVVISACDGDVGDMVTDGTDCDDADPEVYPGAAEDVCDGIDNDCDAEVDEGGTLGFADADGDGFGDPDTVVSACVPGSVMDGTDCDDSSASAYPGAPEICDDIDNDCDSEIDEEEECLYTCGDSVLDEGEERDPPSSPFSTVDVDELTCRWDFSEVEQLFCGSGCSWAGGFGCDSADADVFCKLRTGNPDSVAESYTITTTLSAPGFPCPSGYPTVYTDRGVDGTVYYTDLNLLTTHGVGDVITDPVCTEP